jgi:hypothetical protein
MFNRLREVAQRRDDLIVAQASEGQEGGSEGPAPLPIDAPQPYV